MASIFLLAPLITSFLITLFLMPYWIRKAKEIGLVWDDVHKFNSPRVAGSGGVIVAMAFTIGVLIYVSYQVFILNSHNSHLVETFALLAVILMLSSIGFIDDILGWRRGGLSRRSRLLLVMIAAIPLMAINAGKSAISLPFIGVLDIGILYPLLAIPIGIAGTTTTYNFLAGYNGLEAGQGVLILSALAVVAFLTGNSWLSIIALTMVTSLLAFLLFNFYPAKVFPGDTLTYMVGGAIAIFSVLGDFERVAIFFFVPYILETFLKSRGRLVKHSFGLPKKDNSLDLRYHKIYSLTHISIHILKSLKTKVTEKKVVLIIWTFQLIIIILGFVLFKEGIFLN